MSNDERSLNDLRVHQAYKRVFESPDGKVVFDDMKKRALFESTTFNENPLVMAYNEGWRASFLYIRQRMDSNKYKELAK